MEIEFGGGAGRIADPEAFLRIANLCRERECWDALTDGKAGPRNSPAT